MTMKKLFLGFSIIALTTITSALYAQTSNPIEQLEVTTLLAKPKAIASGTGSFSSFNVSGIANEDKSVELILRVAPELTSGVFNVTLHDNQGTSLFSSNLNVNGQNLPDGVTLKRDGDIISIHLGYFQHLTDFSLTCHVVASNGTVYPTLTYPSN